MAVGDRVTFDSDPHHGNVITGILARRNYIIRRSTNLSKQTHVLAANLDLAVLVATLFYPKVSLGFIDRFLVTAEAYGIPCLLVFNKSDMWSPEVEAIYTEYKAIYNQAGYEVMACSAIQKSGLSAIQERLTNKTSLISGFSGVGKSSLLNALYPGLDLRTGELSDYSLKGKHTTTFAEMFEPIPGTRIIDTPGIKELGIIELEGAEIGHFFPEIRAVLSACRFHNCTHEHEPACAVKMAVENGEIAEERYQSYLSILKHEDQFN